ncbi:putative entry exclusion protein TrbK-alt [Bradyrhizobium sp. SSUT112]|uniref:putative entry exclusion protein TrbK-alt n=1 Tax=Bradyrhizobium sp. SSUT112 TaxID=3040604 RepID=UPI0024488195|nr:putative entry exclusion protein TrbK-alt [Bradyrhizobium sp. SSUT112]MDH2355175.1 putative entry exclusion protein TrbK-alt [Bradyrhizobium sp. SSUT112]
MTDTGPFKALSLLMSVGVLVVAGCAIQLRGGENTSAPPIAEQTKDINGSELARCRTVSSEDAADYQHCQKVWAENRRRFFVRRDGAAAAVTSPTSAPKDQSRMPQGYPAAGVPEGAKP